MANKTPSLSGVQADRSFFALDGKPFETPERHPDGPKATGQAAWSSVKQRQKGSPEPVKSSYTPEEVEEIVKHAVAEALKMFAKAEKAEEKKEPREIKIGGK